MRNGTMLRNRGRPQAHTMTNTPGKPRSVLITGCSHGGIGWALAHKFHKEGFRVFATARRLEAVKDLADAGMTILALDVTDKSSVLAAKERVLSITDGTLDILVNNAGQPYSSSPAIELDSDGVRAVFEVNVFGVMLMVKAFSDLLVASKNSPRIVMISSIAAEAPFAFSSAYCATKGALHSYANALRLEMAPFGVQVTTVVTGAVSSNIPRERYLPEDSRYASIREAWAASTPSPSTMMTVETYAERLVPELLRESLNPWIYEGKHASMVWFLTRFLPISMQDYLISKMFKLDEFAQSLRI